MAKVDNRKVIQCDGGTEQVTEQNLSKMNATQAGETPPRPAMTTHQSSSLPSTPYIHPRELLGSFRTPSPMSRNAEATSPRTARSESDGTLRPPGRTPFLSGCKYETGLAHSRRRIPYSQGGEKLESSPTKVTRHIDPAEEKKLSGDMRELYDRLLPSDESEERRARFVAKLERLLNERWPGNDIKVHVFGSSGNLLWTNDSDVDICITTPMKALERTCLLAKALGEYGMENVVCIPHAKVPIVKIWDPELKLACDMNVNNSAALNNTRMIKTYVQIDPRVRPLAMIVKYWTRKRVLNDAALGGTLSSYTWICMIINYLQTRSPKILPTLQQPPYLNPANVEKEAFYDDWESLKGFGKYNKDTLGELLFGFFRRYGHEINYEREVVSIRQGALLSKQDKKWHLLQNNRLGVEEPFNVERNLGNTADDTSFRGVHLELRRAFDLVSQGKLDECCEQYEFPVQKEKFWTRPAPQPKPVLTRSQSQSGRPVKSGGTNGKSNNSSQRHRNGNSNRRASSATALNKVPMYSAVANGDRSISSNQIHDHLIHHYQMLQHQEQQLRLQMHQRAQATLHAQVTAQVQPPPLHIQTGQYSQPGTPDSRRRPSNIEPPPLSAPLRTVQAYYYPVPMINQSPVHSLSPSLPASQNATSPSSPSQSSVQTASSDMRRGSHRSAVSDSNGTLRSHSQPPTTMKVYAQNGRPPPAPPYHPTIQGTMQGYTTLQQYQQAFMQGQGPESVPARRSETLQLAPESSEAVQPPGLYYSPAIPDPVPREYVGYYVDPTAFGRSRDRNGLAPQILGYTDPAHRARTVSPNLTRLRRQTSRSPSPSQSSTLAGHSINFYSSESSPYQQYSRGIMGDCNPQSAGPVIVDGSSDISDYTTPPETIYYPPHPSSERASSNSDDRPIHTPTTDTGATPVQESVDPFSLDGLAERVPVLHTSGVLQFGEFPARATFRTPQGPKSDEVKSPEKIPIPSIRKQSAAGDIANGLGIVASASMIQDHPLLAQSLQQKPVHHSTTLSGLNLASSLKSLATLSPVREVRTPSPTATRSHGSLASDGSDKAPRERAMSLNVGKDPGPSPLAMSAASSSAANDRKSLAPKREAVTSAELKTKEVTQPLMNGFTLKSHEKTSPKPDERAGATFRDKASPSSTEKTTSRAAEKAPSQPGFQQGLGRVNNVSQSSGWQQSTGKKRRIKSQPAQGRRQSRWMRTNEKAAE